jgi:hypothetical protein
LIPTRRWRRRALQTVEHIGGIVGAAVGRLPGLRYARFLALRSRALAALRRRRYDPAAALALELLQLANHYRGDWYYGNAVHHGHLILGRVALAGGDISRARQELLAAGETPGSPQLNSFGPNMQLAFELLRAGERDVVLQFFTLCRRFWQLGEQHLDYWANEVTAGREPEFGANLLY